MKATEMNRSEWLALVTAPRGLVTGPEIRQEIETILTECTVSRGDLAEVLTSVVIRERVLWSRLPEESRSRQGGDNRVQVAAFEWGGVAAGAAHEGVHRREGRHWGAAAVAVCHAVGIPTWEATEVSSPVLNILTRGRLRWNLAAKITGLFFKLGIFFLETAIFLFSYLELLSKEGKAGLKGVSKSGAGEDFADGIEGIHAGKCEPEASGLSTSTGRAQS